MNNVYIKKALNMNVWAYVFINILTLDIYFLYLQYKLTNILKTELKDEEYSSLVNKLKLQFNISFHSSAAGLVIFFLSLMGFDTLMDSYLNDAIWLLSFVSGVLWSFTTRKVLYIYVLKTHDVEVDIPGVLLFLFPGIMLITAVKDIETNIELKKIREKNKLL